MKVMEISQVSSNTSLNLLTCGFSQQVNDIPHRRPIKHNLLTAGSSNLTTYGPNSGDWGGGMAITLGQALVEVTCSFRR